MIVKSQDNAKLIINPHKINTGSHDTGIGGYIYVDDVLMAYYTEIENLVDELQRLEIDLIDERKSFQFKKERPCI